MAKKDKGPVHPAKKFFQIAAALMALALLLNFITFFVPWTMKKPNSTAHYSYHLWWNCYWNPQSTTSQITCQENVYEVGSGTSFIPVFSDTKARGYFMATQAFVVISFVFLVLSVVVLALCMSKIWEKPISLAGAAACLVFFTWVFLMLAWIMYVVYAEHPVWGQLPGFPWNTSVGTFTNGSVPVRGYSYGFILTVIAAVLALLASLVTCLGLNKLRTWHPHPPAGPMLPMAPYPPPYMPPPAPVYPPVPMPPPMAPAPAYSPAPMYPAVAPYPAMTTQYFAAY